MCYAVAVVLDFKHTFTTLPTKVFLSLSLPHQLNFGAFLKQKRQQLQVKDNNLCWMILPSVKSEHF